MTAEQVRMTPWMPERSPKVIRRMGKLGEELAELTKVCFRIIIQGYSEVDPGNDKPNVVSLEEEIADVVAQCLTTVKTLTLNRDFIDRRVGKKMDQMEEWESLVIDKDKTWPKGDSLKTGTA